MARRFQVGQRITLPAPAALTSGGGTDAGPLTVMLTVKINTTGYQCPIYARTSGGSHSFAGEFTTTGGVTSGALVGGTTARTCCTVTRSAWANVFLRKDAGGTFQPIGRVLSGAGFATDSGDTTAASTLADGPALDSGGTLTLGRWGTADDSDDIEVAGVALWRSILAGATCAGLTTWALALAGSPSYWVSLEGSSVTDSAGGTPTITGAPSVTADPSGFFAASSVSAVLGAPLGGLAASMAAGVRSSAVLGAPLGGLAASMAAGVRSSAVLGAPLGGLAASMAASPHTPGSAVSAVLAAPLGGLAASLRARPRTGVRAVIRPAAVAPPLRVGRAASAPIRPADPGRAPISPAP